jgi:hypothetical protein
MGAMLFCGTAYSQQRPVDKSIDGRYIIIDDFAGFFTDRDSIMESTAFYVCNIDDSQSSKPYYEIIQGNMKKEVKNFSLKSRSEKYEMQRECHLSIYKRDYKSTFIKVLSILEVKYVLHNGTLMNLDEFYSTIK